MNEVGVVGVRGLFFPAFVGISDFFSLFISGSEIGEFFEVRGLIIIGFGWVWWLLGDF